jgi:hypothetical protein
LPAIAQQADVLPPNEKNRPAYFCANARRRAGEDKPACPTGFTSARLADPMIGTRLEEKLGSAEVLSSIVEAALGASDKLAAGSLRAYHRKLAELDNRRAKLLDAYVDGRLPRDTYRKRDDAAQAERAAVERLIARESEDQPEVTPALVAKLAEVFASWTLLRRDEKRRLLREFGVRVVVSRPEKRQLRVEAVRLAPLASRLVLKKMKRLGIE